MSHDLTLRHTYPPYSFSSVLRCDCRAHYPVFSSVTLVRKKNFFFNLPDHTKMPSLKTFKTKQKLGKAQKQNRPLPQWVRLRTNNKNRYNAKRRHWKRTKLGI
ncbi:BA75_02692T0 [Komagataella pastoris]|nr:BA75_02692T0 [Komagataella pastoris]